ncbi:MAG TPA: PDZ domain-containing protein [Bacteroidia bacterium]
MKGIYVNGLTENGSAESAGVQLGDVITKVEGFEVNNVSALQEQVSKYRPGDKVNVCLIRGNKEITLPVVLKNKDGNVSVVKKEKVEVKEVKSIASLGASFEQVGKNDMKKLNIEGGVRVTELQNGKLFAAGVKEGFIITSIDKKKISTLTDIESAVKNKKGGILIEGVYPNGMHAYYGFGM